MLYGIKLVALVAVTLPATFLTFIFGVFAPYSRGTYAISRFWSWSILALGGVTLRVDGLNRIEPGRQYIFMANHQSNLDIPILLRSLPGFQLRWLAKRELLWIPFLGWALWAAKHITVDRGDRRDALRSLKQAQERIAHGISVVIFPEGTRSADGRLLPFRRGGFFLAVKSQTPIVPVTISGSGKNLAKGDWRVRRGEVRVTVGDPISVQDGAARNLRALSARVRDLIDANLERTAGNGRWKNGETGSARAVQAAAGRRPVE